MADKEKKDDANQPRIVFRKIHGHIVPIKVGNGGLGALKLKKNADKGEVVSGGGLAALGVGAALVAGRASEKLAEGARGAFSVARAFNRASDHYHTQERITSALRTGKKAVLALDRGVFLKNASKITARAGVLGGAALIGAGVHQALSQTRLKDDAKTKAAIGAGAGVAAAFALETAVFKTTGLKWFDAIVQATKAIAKKKVL
jgi:hypothetical protein